MGPLRGPAVAAGLLVGALACSPAPESGRTSSVPAPTETPRPSPAKPGSPSTATTAEPEVRVPEVRVPEPRRSFVTVPALGLRDFPVVRYRGAPDDAPGTRIQDAGEMASPRGPRGGVGPGEVGNFIVTGHRLTGTAPLRDSPSLRRGDRILVRSGATVHKIAVLVRSRPA